MKQILISIFLFLFTSPALTQAKEESAPRPLPLNLIQAQVSRGDVPFEVLVNREGWIQARPGTPFTAGFHSADFVLPSLKEMPSPIQYPRWAAREGWEGTFVIAVEILPSGKVGRWKIMETTGYSLLDEAATKAVQSWRFHPATEKGRPVVSCIEIPVHFSLQSHSR